MKKYTAYSITCTQTGMSYIGMTGQRLKDRMKCHIGRAKEESDAPLYTAVRLLGWDSFRVLEIASCKGYDAAQELERVLIASYNTLYPNGYNLETGGNLGKRASEFTKKRLSEAHTGLAQTAETVAKRSIAMVSAYDKDEGRLRKVRSEQSLGAIHSEEWNAKIGRGNTGKVRSAPLKKHLGEKTAQFAASKRAWAERNNYSGPLNSITKQMIELEEKNNG